MEKLFRAWDTYNKKMRYDNDFVFMALLNQDAKTFKGKEFICPVMQCTGMNDKNLNTIWEGDFIKLYHQGEWAI